MRFIPLGQEDQEQPTQLKFIPLEEEKPSGPVYQDVGEVGLTSPEEMLAPPSAKPRIKPEDRSVMEGYVSPEKVDTRTALPAINTEARRMYDAATPAQRAQLVKRDPVFKQLDEAYQAQDEQTKEAVSKRVTKPLIDPYMFDTRAEYRKESLIKQGLNPDLAETTARRMAAAGIESKLQPYGEIKESPEEYAMAEDLRLRPGMSPAEQAAQVAKRGGVKAFVGLGQAGAGMRSFVNDAFGLDSTENQQRLDSMERFSQAMGQPASKPVAIFEGAINSIAQQLPALVVGAATGSEPVVLASMFANSFGQTYDESRRAKLDFGAATARSAAFAAFEVLGERFGLKEQLAGIKAAAKGVPTKDVTDYFAKALVKEIPGEQLTYAGQFAVDKGFGMNPEAGIKAFLEGSVDTMLSTVVQSGMMMGGGSALNKIVRSVAKERPEIIEAIPDAYELAKSKGFFPEKKTKEVTKEKKEIADQAAQQVQSIEQAVTDNEATALYNEAVTRFQRQGFAPSDAARFAEEELKEAGYGPDEINAGRSQSGLSVSSGATPDGGLAAAPAGVDQSGVGQVSQPVDRAGARTTEFISALEPYKAELAKEYGSAVADKITARAAEMNIEDGGLTPETAIRAATAEVIEDSALPSSTPDVPATGMQPKGKKASPGRPKIVLTPEQKQEKLEQRKLSQKASINAGRTVDKAAKVLDEPFDISAFPDETAAKDAQETRDAEVIEALVSALRVANDPKFRKNKPGIRARELIDRFPPNSRVRQIAEARAKLGQPSQSLTTTTNEHDPDMLMFNDAPSLLGYIKAFGTAFEKVLADRIRPYVKGVRVVHVADADRDIIDDRARGSFSEALGMYFRKAIYLNANPESSGENNETALHEALHAATVSKIDRYYTNPDSLSNSERMAVRQLQDVRERAFRYYEELQQRAADDPQFETDNIVMLAKLDQLADPDGINVFGDLREFVSYGMTQPEFQEFLMQAPGQFDPKNQRTIGLFTKFVQALRQLLNMGPEHMSALQDLIIVTDRIMGAAPLAGTPALARKAKGAKKQEAKVDKDVAKIQVSNDAYTATKSLGKTIPAHGFEYYKELLDARYDAMGNKFITKLLFTMQTSDILRWKGDQIAGLVDVDRIQQEMSAMKTHMLNASAEKADKLGAFIRKNGMQVISSTMHLARLKKVSPTAFATLAEAQQKDPVVVHYERILTDATYRQQLGLDTTLTQQQETAYKNKQKQRQDDIKIVYDSWAALGKQKNGHEMYKMVRQFYKDNYLAYRTILNEQIDSLPIEQSAKDKLLKSVRLMQEQAKGAPDPDYDGMTLKQMPEEYFPFMRHGQYWLRVTKGPAGRELHVFDTGEERNAFLKLRAKQLGKDPNDGSEFAAGDDLRALRADFATDSLMLQQMFAAIDEAKADGRFNPANYKTEADAKAAFDAYREELKDQLYQTYLMTLPERSFRKQFLHAENVTGFSSDIFRNFKTSATAYANQLAKLKYADQIRNGVQRARDSLEGMPPLERARLELFINEIDSRANEEIDPPPPSQVVSRINQFAFIMLLTGGATAATQMASIPIMVMPTLKQRYGTLAAGKEFLRFATFFKTMGITKKQPNGDVEYTAPSIGSSAMVRNDPILERAFQAALDRHVTTLTNTSVLTNRNRTPDNSYDSIPGAAARVSFNIMTGLFNGAERMSREITYMMTFKLEYAKTKDFDKSVEAAVNAVHELLGRYDNFNRPPIFRNAIGSTVGQFKMYSVFVSSWFVRNGYTAFTEGMGSREGRAAMERLVGVLVMGGLFHGLVGQPLYSVICDTIDLILDAIEDDEEKQARRARNPLTAESANLRFRYEFLPKHFGEILIPGIDGREHRLSEILEKGPISVLTDMNIGSRTSFDGIWFREATPGKTYLETVQNYILQNMGPGVSTGINMVGAIDDFSSGKIQRGLEKLVPAFFKGSLVAYRLDTEGAETKGGDKMLKRSEINDLNLIAAATGFQPARLARIQEKNFAFQKEITEAETSKAKALRALNETIFNQERQVGDMKPVIEKIKKHNKRYPMESFLIDADTIDRSIEAYEEAKGLTYRGQRMSEKLLPYIMPASRVAAPVPPKEVEEPQLKFKPLQ